MGAIFKKELKAYFLSPIAYIYIGIFLLTCSLFFYLDIFNYQSTDFANMFGSAATILTFIVPILTMRMFAEERKNGTEQLLLTSPRSITSIVLGKFFATACVVLISTILTLMYFAILMFFGQPHLLSSLVAILGFSLLAIAYVSFGMFASSITENQVIAAVISIGVFMLLWFLPSMAPGLNDYSLMYSFYKSFMSGTIALRDLTLLLSFSAIFTIFTIMVIQRRKSVK
ncbi:MAG: ABC transporter permease subunit [Clostridia bacterium]|nr:ABC transporter permease subunit [Clostridia bacterium]